MSCGTPLCFVKPVLILAGIAAVGMGGYNFATKGCPLGGCPVSKHVSNFTTVDHSGDTQGCPLGGCSDSEETGTPGVLLTSGAATSAPAAAGCCEAMKAAAATSAECAMAAELCEGMTPEQCKELCETQCPHAVQAGEVAEGETAEQAEAAGNAG
jgi:hypothetical protein